VPVVKKTTAVVDPSQRRTEVRTGSGAGTNDGVTKRSMDPVVDPSAAVNERPNGRTKKPPVVIPTVGKRSDPVDDTLENVLETSQQDVQTVVEIVMETTATSLIVQTPVILNLQETDPASGDLAAAGTHRLLRTALRTTRPTEYEAENRYDRNPSTARTHSKRSGHTLKIAPNTTGGMRETSWPI
jgi:hypothetical protein